MFRMLTACTKEIDFPDEAIEELTGQLDLGGSLLKNSIGIVHCGYEYIESGFLALLCELLPFDVVGSTTISGATRGEYGPTLLTLSVLTGDDVMFSTALSDPLPLPPDDVGRPLSDAYRRAAETLPGKPALVIAHLPLNTAVGVSLMLDGITNAGGDVPVFGALACEEMPDYANSLVIFNGKAYPGSGVLVLAFGALHPRFFVESLAARERLHGQQGVITESEGCVVKQVNGMPFLEYMEDMGMPPEIMREAKAFPIPFKVDYNEGTKGVIRVLFSVTPEGHAVFVSEMPVGASMSLQRIGKGDVMETVADMAEILDSLDGIQGVLLHSCIGRSYLLGLQADDEMIGLSGVAQKAPCQLSYSGAELCPLEDEKGTPINHTHAYSLTACVFLERPKGSDIDEAE